MSGSLSYSPQFLDSIAHPNLLDPAQATIDGNKAAASVWANRLSQAQQAAGQAQLAGVRPDGSFDPAAAALAMGPNTALAAGPTLESNQAIAGRQQDQALKNLTVQSAALDSLGPNATGAQVQAKIQEGMKGGWLQPNEANQVLTGMPMGDDPQSMATRSHMLQVMGDQIRTASERLQSQYGLKSTQTGPNGQTIGLSTDQRTGAVSTPQQPGAPLGPSPDTKLSVGSQVSTIIGPDGRGITDTLDGHIANHRVSPAGVPLPGYSVTGATPAMVSALRGQEATPDGRTSVSGARGVDQVTPGFFQTYAQPGESFDSKRDVEAVANRGIAALEAKYPNDPGRVATAYFSGPGNVSQPGSANPWIADKQDPNGASTSGYVSGVLGRYKPAAAPSATSGTAGPAPGVVDAANATAKDSAAMGGALVNRADQVPMNKANYALMLSDLGKLDTMGPGTDRETAINGVLQKLTGYGVTMTKDQVAGSESFSKLANMIAAQQLGSLGPTDARQSLAMGANPHLDLSKLGNTQILHMLQGNEDAVNAKAQAWQQWIKPVAQGGAGNTPASYGQFSTDFNHNFDPRVFQQQYMGPKEVESLRQSMVNNPGEMWKFREDVRYAKAHGWIAP